MQKYSSIVKLDFLCCDWKHC